MAKYKKSNYNYFVDYRENKKLLFNGLTGACFCITSSEYQVLEPLLNDTEKFESEYPSDLQRLYKLGYLTESDFDEIAYMKYKNRQAVFQNKAYHLTINPTLECNFRCWYCYEEHPKGYMSKATIARIKRHITYM
ncbi:MAG: radical SAM/SPASM domain-containing protein, partial [Bacteroidales bacterium]|nr:radical SAM/SPASM domain-containing protein [Bacteroidales bacterium]